MLWKINFSDHYGIELVEELFHLFDWQISLVLNAQVYVSCVEGIMQNSILQPQSTDAGRRLLDICCSIYLLI
jgi:hypothetical protein